MHGVVRDLRSPFVVCTLQRYRAGSLQEVADHRGIRATSEIAGKTSAQRRFGAPGDRTFLGGIVPTEKAPRRRRNEKSARKAADSALAGSNETMPSRKAANCSRLPCTGSAQTSSSVKSGAIWALTHGCASWAEFGSLTYLSQRRCASPSPF